MTKKTRYFMAGSAAVLAGGLVHGAGCLLRRRLPGRLSASTGPTELSLRAGRRRVVAYADVKSIMDSELRQRLKQSVPMPMRGRAAGILREDRHRHRARHRLRRGGGDCAPGNGNMHPNGVVVARGRFDTCKLEGLRASTAAVAGLQGQAAADPPAQLVEPSTRRSRASPRPLRPPA